MCRYVLIVIAILLLLPSPALAGDIVLLVSDADSYAVNKAVQGLELPSDICVRYFTPQDLGSNRTASQAVAKAEVIVADVMHPELTRFLLQNADIKDKRLYALRGSGQDQELKEKGFLFEPNIRAYYQHLSVPNIQNMLYRIVHLDMDPAVTYKEVRRRPKTGIYHPEAGHFFQDFSEYRQWYIRKHQAASARPWLGIMIYPSYLCAGKRQCMDQLISGMEQAGWNVAACFGSAENVLASLLTNQENQAVVDEILAFSLKFDTSEQVKKALAQLDVPVFNAVSLYGQTIPQWRDSPRGIPPTQVTWTMANPEISGLIEPTPLIGPVKVRDPETGREVTKYRLIQDNLQHLLPRLNKWQHLATMRGKEKKVAIIYYNHHRGKQNIGASYLNVFASLKRILQRMHQEGYQVSPGQLPTEKRIKELILRYGRNIGSWAPGELKEMISSGNLVRVPISRYKEWFAELPQKFQDRVLEQWGPVEESNIMIKDGDLIIPCVKMGNVVLLPEPARGWSDSPMKLYHSPTLQPHHQYIAAYLWLKHCFKADAMIHLGTHATYEWLPGKQAGLSPSDPPEIMTTDIPNLYPYVMDDVGEGIQAKRRGRGVIIDHLTPPMRKGGLYKEYSRLYDLINGYKRLQAKGSRTAKAKLQKIGSLCRKLGLLQDLGITDVDDKESLQKIEHYLQELKRNLMPYGLHTFGRSPKGDALQDMVKAISEANPDRNKERIRQGLTQSGSRELDRLMRGLDGEYIPAREGNDPLRNPAALPTGNDFFGFDPEKIPSQAAWKLGKKAARQMIHSSLEKNGTYPQKVAVVLWATETIRNQGVNESTILALLGIKPTWGESGRVTGMRVIPGDKLGRPRIDVLINPSGLYRDLFPGMLNYLDRAVQKAALQTDIRNLLRQHSARLKQQLLAQGLKEDKANRLSRVRIFTEKPGSYGTGVSQMTGKSGTWKSDQEIAEVYENRVGYAYGQGMWGKSANKLLKRQLSHVDTAVHSRSSNVYGTMDNDDMFQYLGGLSLAVRKESGQAPQTLITQQQEPGEVQVENASKSIGRELRTRYLNPKWIQGMKQEGYAGAREMSKFLDNMWGWQVTTPQAVDQAKWEQTYQVYVKDKYGQDLKEFFNQASPWAYQSITARMLEAIRKGYWQAGEKVKKKLAAEYAMNVVQKGVACCHHTCNNPMLNQMVVSIISLPGIMSPKTVEQFKVAMRKATGMELQKRIQNRKDLQKKLSQSLKQSAPSREQAQDTNKAKKPGEKKAPKGSEKEKVKGYKMEKIDGQEKTTKLSSSGVQWFVSLGILLLIGLFFMGSIIK